MGRDLTGKTAKNPTKSTRCGAKFAPLHVHDAGQCDEPADDLESVGDEAVSHRPQHGTEWHEVDPEGGDGDAEPACADIPHVAADAARQDRHHEKLRPDPGIADDER